MLFSYNDVGVKRYAKIMPSKAVKPWRQINFGNYISSIATDATDIFSLYSFFLKIVRNINLTTGPT